METAQKRQSPEPRELQAIRREIDDLDTQIIDLLARRFGAARQTVSVKERHALGAVDTQREAQVVRRAAALARDRGLEPELVRDIYWRLIELSKVTP